MPSNPQSSRNARRDAKVEPKPPYCPICLTAFTSTGKRRAVFDHCHGRGHFRGWLCDFCNRGLGIFSDDPDALMRAAQYLIRDRAVNPGKLWQRNP